MKRYIRSASKTAYFGEQVGRGLLRTPDDKETYGEQNHKRYRGLAIRDFRNGWLGKPELNSVKPRMDILLDAFDIISQEFSYAKARFFNISAFNDGDVSLLFLLSLDVPDPERYPELYYHDSEYAYESISIREDMSFYSDIDPEYRYAIEGTNATADKIAKEFIEAVHKFENWATESLNRRQKLKQAKLDKLKDVSTISVPTDELIVPITVDFEERVHSADDLPSDDEIRDNIEAALESANLVETANKYLKEIRVGFLWTTVTICMYPKVKFKRFRLDASGDSVEAQFETACRRLPNSSRWFNELLAEVDAN